MLKLTEDQAALLSEMPKHSRRVIETRLLSGLDVSVETGVGVETSARNLSGLQVEMKVFLRVVDQVFALPELNEAKREQLYQAWLDQGCRCDGVALWRLAQRINCKLSRVNTLLERWEQSATTYSRWQQMVAAFQHGASHSLLQQFFNCTPLEFVRLRSDVRCHNFRKKRLDEEEDIAFYQLWKSFDCRDDVECLLLLSGKTGYAISLIWPLIKDWLDTEQYLTSRHSTGRG